MAKLPVTSSIVSSAVVGALVGFGGTLALIVAAGQAVGASGSQIASWVTALCLVMAATSGYLSFRHRIPIITAWSTPGAALIGASSGISFEAAIGAFVFAGLLLTLTGLFRPISDAINRIPKPIAAAMLAGVLLQFVLAVFESLQIDWAFVLPMVLVFLVVRVFNASLAVIAVLIYGLVLAFLLGKVSDFSLSGHWFGLSFFWPDFDLTALIGLGLPLYLVTMASQNLPGFAVLQTDGYEPPVRSILTVTGLASLISAFFGAHSSNLAAITAALCTGPDTHKDPSERWKSGLVYGLVYLVLALFGASLVTLFAALPASLIVTVAGLALITPFIGAMSGALAQEESRFSAILTFAITASGLGLFGIGSAFWGLVGGLLAFGTERGLQEVLRRLD